MKSQRISAWLSALTILSVAIISGMAAVPAARAAAEIELGDTSMADGLASAFVILRNNDQPRGYTALTVRCVFQRAGQSVGEASAPIKELRYHEHLAERLSTFIKGDSFDNTVCTFAKPDAP